MTTRTQTRSWIRLLATAGWAAAALTAGHAADAKAAGTKEAPPPGKAKTSVALPLAPRFNQTRARIGALFEHRNEAPSPPQARSNPFRPAGPLITTPREPTPAGAGDGVAAPDDGSTLGLLQQSAATLKVSGTFEIGGTTHLVINRRPYKEGDVVPTQVGSEAVYLRVRSISDRSVTLVLDGTEMTLKF